MSESIGQVLKTVATTALSSAVGGVVSNALKPKQQAQPSMPTPTTTAVSPVGPPPSVEDEPVPTMPTPDNKAAIAQNRKKASRTAARRGGRASTILTASDDVGLGG